MFLRLLNNVIIENFIISSSCNLALCVNIDISGLNLFLYQSGIILYEEKEEDLYIGLDLFSYRFLTADLHFSGCNHISPVSYKMPGNIIIVMKRMYVLCIFCKLKTSINKVQYILVYNTRLSIFCYVVLFTQAVVVNHLPLCSKQYIIFLDRLL